MIEAFLPDGVSAGFATLLVAVSFLTSGLTAAMGIGGGMLMLALMSYGLPIAALIPVHGAVQLGSNGGRLLIQRSHVAWGFLAVFAIGAAIGAVVGASLVIELPEAWLTGILGTFILLITWVPMPRLERLPRAGIATAGFATTFATMFVGATGPLNAALFSASLKERHRLVATLAALMTSQHLFKVLAFGLAGFAFAAWLPLVGAMIATGFAGTWVGSHLLARMPEKTFRIAIKVLLTLMAADMLRRSLGAFF